MPGICLRSRESRVGPPDVVVRTALSSVDPRPEPAGNHPVNRPFLSTAGVVLRKMACGSTRCVNGLAIQKPVSFRIYRVRSWCTLTPETSSAFSSALVRAGLRPRG
jgi:hypothetical protein